MYTNYTIKVSASNKIGAGPQSNAIVITTADSSKSIELQGRGSIRFWHNQCDDFIIIGKLIQLGRGFLIAKKAKFICIAPFPFGRMAWLV